MKIIYHDNSVLKGSVIEIQGNEFVVDNTYTVSIDEIKEIKGE